MKLITKETEYPSFVLYDLRGNSLKFPKSKMVENAKQMNGNKRDMRKKLFKSPYPTYNQNRIINRAESGMKFAEFKPVNPNALDTLYSAPEIVDILLANKSNSEFDYLNLFEDIKNIVGISLNKNYNLLDNLGIEDTPIVLSTYNTSNFNVDAAIDYLNKHAHSKTTGACALYVREALEAGGLNTAGHPTSAADYIGFMGKMGFNLVSGGNGNNLSSDYVPQKGDVIVIGRVGNHKHGHIAMYNGHLWVSDFKLKSFQIYDKINNFTIWRHT